MLTKWSRSWVSSLETWRSEIEKLRKVNMFTRESSHIKSFFLLDNSLWKSSNIKILGYFVMSGLTTPRLCDAAVNACRWENLWTEPGKQLSLQLQTYPDLFEQCHNVVQIHVSCCNYMDSKRNHLFWFAGQFWNLLVVLQPVTCIALPSMSKCVSCQLFINIFLRCGRCFQRIPLMNRGRRRGSWSKYRPGKFFQVLDQKVPAVSYTAIKWIKTSSSSVLWCIWFQAVGIPFYWLRSFRISLSCITRSQILHQLPNCP